jgi:hypothetical protein
MVNRLVPSGPTALYCRKARLITFTLMAPLCVKRRPGPVF